MALSRREFVCTTAAAGAAACLPATGQIMRPSPIELRAEPFPLTQVRLLSGPMQTAAAVNDAYLQSLPIESLAHMFRVTAGLPSSAAPLGGWEAPSCELRGHFAGGHYLSSCALRYAATGDARVRQQGEAVVGELAACQKALGSGYLSAFPESVFDKLESDKPAWAPFYTLHKIMAGALDMHTLCGSAQGLAVAAGLGDWIGHWVKDLGDDQLQRILQAEFGGLAESLWNLSAMTGERKYAYTARRFEKRSFLTPLAAHRDALKGLHVNTHIPQVIAAGRAYELTGDPRYREITQYFWREVVQERSYAPGGTSNGEHWDSDPGQLGHSLSRYTQECCCGYNMLKLTRQLYTWSADPRYFDYYERTLWNSRLGTQHPGNGGKMYYLPLQTGWWKYFSSPLHSFWCCDGTGAEEFSKFGDSIYFHHGGALYVNLFIPSTLGWPEQGLKLTQQTRFPASPDISLTLELEQPRRMAVNLRIPGWTAPGGRVSVNGRTLEAFAAPGSYLILDQIWRSGDRIDLHLPMALRSEALAGDAGQIAACYGPLVLAADLGTNELTPAMQYDANRGDTGPYGGTEVAATQGHAQGATTLQRADRAGGADWLAPDGELRFHTVGQANETALLPLHQILPQRYGVYWRVTSRS